MNLNSKKYGNITYEKGEEIILAPDEANLPFYFDVTEDLTENGEAMYRVAAALDEVNILEKTAKDFLKSALADDKNAYYETVAHFMEFHREELDTDIIQELFLVDSPNSLSLAEMVDYLKVQRFGSFIDDQLKQQLFIMDLNFNPEVTDELLVVYFDLDKRVVTVDHES